MKYLLRPDQPQNAPFKSPSEAWEFLNDVLSKAQSDKEGRLKIDEALGMVKPKESQANGKFS